MKKNILKILTSITIGFGLSAMHVTPAHAAYAPGCYEESTNGFIKKTCPEGTGYQKNVDQRGACYVLIGATSADEKSCTDLTSDPAKNSQNSNQSTSGRQVIDADCEAEILNKDNCNIIKYLVNGINFLSALAGMAIIGSIMIAGYQYMTARDNSGQVEAAKKRILWAMIALGVFIFMYAFLNWVVPGGVVAV